MTTTPTPGFRDRLRRRETVIGLAACVVRTVEIVTVARSCGYDFLLVDTEHTALAISDVATLCVAAATAAFPALVRVGGPDHPDLARVLDCGALGIVISHVETLDQARRIVERCRFAPAGRRSIPSPQASLGFLTPPVRDSMDRIERETVIVLMVESRPGLAEAAAMAALPGVDALMVGANDLAADLDHAGDVGHPEVLAAFARVAEACRTAGKAFGVIGLGETSLASHAWALGATLVVATNDINILVEGGAAALERTARGGEATSRLDR